MFAMALHLLSCPISGASNAGPVTSADSIILELHAPGGGIRSSTNAPGEDLIDITLEDVPLKEVVYLFTKLTKYNIIANPNDLYGSVTVNLTGVKALVALDAILDMHNLELVERYPGSCVFAIRKRRSYGSLTNLLFQEQGKALPTNRIHVTVTNAPLSEVLLQIARQSKINICYETKLATEGNFTMDIADAEYLPLLEHIQELQGLSVERSRRLDAYIVEGGFRNMPQSESQPAGAPAPGNLAIISIAFIAGLAATLGLLFALPAVIIHDAPRFAKTGRSVWRVMIFWPVVLILCIVYGNVIGTWLAWDTFFLSTGIGAGAIASLVTTAVLFGLTILAVNIARTRGWPRKTSHRVLAWLCVLLPIAALMLDWPPIRNDYKWEDLPRPTRDATESAACFQKLMDICPTNIPQCIAYDYYITNALQFAGEIETAWTNASAARELVKRLNTFDGIADPTDSSRYDLWSDAISSTWNMRRLVRIYSAYAILKTDEKQPEEAATRLVEFHTLVRKAMPYSRPLRNKMLLLAVANIDISTAHRIARHPACTPEALAILKNGFPPLSHEDVSLRWCFMTEYLLMRKAFQKDISNARYIEALYLFDPDQFVSGGGNPAPRGSGVLGMFNLLGLRGSSTPGGSAAGAQSSWPPRHRSGFWERNVSRASAFLFFKRNRSTRDLRQYYDLLMEQCAQSPAATTLAEASFDEYSRRPRLSNICGWLIVRSATGVSFSKATAYSSRTLVLSDLLAIELRTLCGEKTDIRDYYTGENYIINPKFGFFKSAGPDGTNGTADDITLGQDR